MKRKKATRYIIAAIKSTGRLIICPGRIKRGSGELMIIVVTIAANKNPRELHITASFTLFFAIDAFFSKYKANKIHTIRINLPATYVPGTKFAMPARSAGQILLNEYIA
jgi:hypothetical protein